MQRYYTIEFETWTWDPEVEGSDGEKIAKKVHNSKPCEPEDFHGLEENLVDSILQTTRENVQMLCMESMDEMFLQGTKMDYSKKIQTFHINIWKCENKYDVDGRTPIGIIDGQRNATEGINYKEGVTCASE